MVAERSRVLVSDFDGTMTQRDFYRCLIGSLITPEDAEPWEAYQRGELTHFEAMEQIFSKILAEEEDFEPVFEEMALDSHASAATRRLHEAGWEVLVVSNGCCWYIDRMLGRQGVSLPVYANPGTLTPEGLQMQRPVDSPYYCEETGIDKSAVIRERLDRNETVAFAGNGHPDLEPALLVPPELRFATGWLASELSRREEAFHRFEAWSEIAAKAIGEDGGGVS